MRALERELRERWPCAFDPARPRPLKVGVREEIAEQVGMGSHRRKRLRRALAMWCGAPRYLEAVLQPSSWRVDLGGEPVEVVAPDHSAWASQRIHGARLRRARRKAEEERLAATRPLNVNHTRPILRLDHGAARRPEP